MHRMVGAHLDPLCWLGISWAFVAWAFWPSVLRGSSCCGRGAEGGGRSDSAAAQFDIEAAVIIARGAALHTQARPVNVHHL
jgi:hypothetical protein